MNIFNILQIFQISEVFLDFFKYVKLFIFPNTSNIPKISHIPNIPNISNISDTSQFFQIFLTYFILSYIPKSVERTHGQEKAQKLRVDWTTLRDTRVSKASDWVSQLSSTEVKAEILDCQLLYSCQVCHLLPARAASWYLLESPHTSRHSWVCTRCGHKWGGCASQRKGCMWPAS